MLKEVFPDVASLGHFWLEDERSEDARVGLFEMKDFPQVSIISLDDNGPQKRKEDAIYGVIGYDKVVTLCECTFTPSKHSWINYGTRIDKADIPSKQYGRRYVGNYAFVGSSKVPLDQCVKRISFFSKSVEQAFKLWPGNNDRSRTVWETVSSRVCYAHGVRLRIQRQTNWTESQNNGARVVLSFLKALSPKETYAYLHRLKNFLSVLCGRVIDDIDPMIAYNMEQRLYQATLFYHRVSETVEDDHSSRWFALLPLARNRDLTKRVVDAWLSQTNQQTIAARIYVESLSVLYTVHAAHVRDLVTCIELLAADRLRPLQKHLFKELLYDLRKLVDTYANKHPKEVSGFEIIKESLNNINHASARMKVDASIRALEYRIVISNFRSPEEFSKSVVSLRNYSTHDPSKISQKDYEELSWYLAKLRLIVAINLAKALDARDDEISPAYFAIWRAQAYGIEPSMP